jgi:uncharacterized protein YeaO (DUF488 family)
MEVNPWQFVSCSSEAPARATRGCASAQFGTRQEAFPKPSMRRAITYDVWLPNLAPSEQLLKAGRSAKDETDWRSFVKRYRSEMSQAENSRVLDLLAALSHQANFSVGCYCNDEQHCHRSVLRQLLAERGASLA